MTRKSSQITPQTPPAGPGLWQLIFAPFVWVAHFLACYGLAAIWCQKAGRDAALGAIKPWIAALTLAGLVAIALILWPMLRTHRRSLTGHDFDFEHNSAPERQRMLTHAAVLLSLLSAVAVVFTAWPVLWLEICR